MPMQVPIGEMLNIFSVAVLLVIAIHFWRRTKESFLPSLQAFTWFFVFILLMMAVFSTPYLLMSNLKIIQVTQNLSHLFFMIAIAFLARFIALLAGFYRLQSFTLYTPIAIVFLGIGVFIWQMSVLKPAITATIVKVEGINFIGLVNTAPLWSSITPGIVGLMVFGIGATLLLKIYFSRSEEMIRRRALYIGLGFLIAIFGVITNFIVGQLPGLFPFFFLASLATLISVLLIYLGTLIRMN